MKANDYIMLSTWGLIFAIWLTVISINAGVKIQNNLTKELITLIKEK